MLPTFIVERLDANALFDLAFVFDTEVFLRLCFHRKAVAIPAPGARHIKAAHRLIAGYKRPSGC